MKSKMILVAVLLAACILAVSAQESAKELGSVRGKISLSVKNIKLKDIGPLIVYLDAVRGKLKYEIPAENPKILQKNAKFSPNFLIVVAGQTVDFPNDDTTPHNVFSFAESNEFDLGLYPKGESRSRLFKEPGMVEVFCSIHSSMNATVFVAPSPYFGKVDSLGSFRIRDVPPGKYRLKTFNEKLPAASRRINVKGGGVTDIEVGIGF